MIAPFDFAPPAPTVPAPTPCVQEVPVSASRLRAIHDAGLVQRFNGGDETAFVEIMSRYREQMVAVAFGMLRNHADAEEIAQDTFIRAHRGLAKFRSEASLATWLHRIALNLARNRYWYFFRRRRHASFSLDCAFSEGNAATFSDLVASDEAGPAREAVAGEFAELIASCMARLGDGPREILTLRNAHDCSYETIAQKLGLNIGTVKSRIARARVSLRRLMAESCPEFGPEAQPVAWFDLVRPRGGVTSVWA